jgi:hypothetical protein
VRPLYVETMIRADLDELWRLTQDPGQHQRWDLRFTRIEYLAPDGRSGPQRFRYSVGMLPGMWIAGTGVCAGERSRPDGSRTSALRFASSQRLSLIRAGAGYWRYIPTPAGADAVPGAAGAAGDRGH